MNVAVLGASGKPDRYSNRAVKKLLENGHKVFPIHPILPEIEGIPVSAKLGDVPEPIDTITVYLSPENSNAVAGDIINSKARRVIFNPGTENPVLAGSLQMKGIYVVHACTLVLLETGQF